MILKHGGPNTLRLPLPIAGRLGRSAAEGIASVQLEKLLARGAIKPFPSKDLIEWFEVDPTLLDKCQGD